MTARKSEEDQPDNYGHFKKDGQDRFAASAAEAVALQFDGWKRVDQSNSKTD